MILADSSAWIAYDRATGSAAHHRVRELLDLGELAVTDPVMAEVWMGARSDRQELELRGLLGACHALPFDVAADFDGAVQIYRRCRQVGVTPRGLVDCMIASVALRHEVAILAEDADLTRVAEVMGLRLDT